MNEKHKLFCIEYIKDFNATRAYRAIYEREVPLKNPRASASKLLKKDDVRAFLAEEIAKIKKEYVAEAEEVMAYFTSVMRGEIDMNDRERNKAAELLAKRFGLLNEQNILGDKSEGVTIIDDV